VGLLIFQNCLAVISNHYLAGVQIPDLWYDGIKANISYSNPNLVSNNDFSGECISLANTTGSWVEVGWMKDPSHIGANIPYAFCRM